MESDPHNLFPDEEAQKAELDLEYRAGVPEAREEIQLKLEQILYEEPNPPQETDVELPPTQATSGVAEAGDLSVPIVSDLDKINEVS